MGRLEMPKASNGAIIGTIPISGRTNFEIGSVQTDKSLNSEMTADRPVPLSRIGVGQSVIVREVRCGISEVEGGDIGLRLLELGFIEGEPLRVVAHGYPGREPIAVRIGNTTFALRRFEAEHVLVVSPPEGESKS
jgi:ferrous iron transport protein A